MEKLKHKDPSPEKYKIWKAQLDVLGQELDRLHKANIWGGPEGEAFRAFRKHYDTCPECGSTNTEVENFDELWRDGDVICQDCRTYVRMFDAG